MTNLLHANFTKLKRDKFFWLTLTVMLVWGLFAAGMQIYNSMKYKMEYEITMDSILFGYCWVIGVVCAIFSSMYIGSDYSDGTVRNKLIVGHKRHSIYLANLITVSTVMFLSCIIFLISVSALGFPFIKEIIMDFKTAVILILCSIPMIIAYSAIFTAISMTNQNKAVVAIISIILAFGLIFAATTIRSILEAEPMISTGFEITASGEVIMGKYVPNPNYLTGMKRKIFEFFYDFLLSGQCEQFMSGKYSVLMPVYSLIITIVSTIAGIGIFKKKNIK